jgi:hypothetical protein
MEGSVTGEIGAGIGARQGFLHALQSHFVTGWKPEAGAAGAAIGYTV